MIAKRTLFGGVIAALLGTALLVTPASAQRQDRDRPQMGCKEDVLKAAGRATFKPFSRKKEEAGEGRAMVLAIQNWQREVVTKYGADYMQWDSAQVKSHDCKPAYLGSILQNFIRCTVSARPCAKAARPEPGREDVSGIQQMLRDRGYRGRDDRRIKVDGNWGENTSYALLQFQIDNKLEQTGYPDEKTLELLRSRRGRRT